MNNMRSNGQVGVLEDTQFDSKIYVHFSEWWNGEGLDFDIESKGEEKRRIALHIDEMRLLVTAMVATGMVDLNEIVHAADKLQAESKARADFIRVMHNEYD